MGCKHAWCSAAASASTSAWRFPGSDICSAMHAVVLFLDVWHVVAEQATHITAGARCSQL
jgi:hypothetical protein